MESGLPEFSQLCRLSFVKYGFVITIYPISMAFSQILKQCVFTKSLIEGGCQKISSIRAGRCFWNERVKCVRGRGWSGRLGFLKLPVVETALCNTSVN